ncbi:hypothetical protein [Saccharopolyspora sp. SCSIO 74807]|uniref:hypothetical protein n=1 Tax=Saccharopolyspora sp. SCSIO 74807 TaxID=3118084 RepID=UPI0030D41DC4
MAGFLAVAGALRAMVCAAAGRVRRESPILVSLEIAAKTLEYTHRLPFAPQRMHLRKQRRSGILTGFGKTLPKSGNCTNT